MMNQYEINVWMQKIKGTYNAEMVLVEAASSERRGTDTHAARVQCGGVSEHGVLV